MERKNFLFPLLFCSIYLLQVWCIGAQGDGIPNTLFVFGDSYVDVGSDDTNSVAWKVPYGLTYPGHPSGRYSDGLVMTDFAATFLGIETPIHYTMQNSTLGNLQFGMNFAYGGSGVFETLSPNPSMGDQIDTFEQLVDNGVYNNSVLQNSTALVSLTGADYYTYLATGGTYQGLPAFMRLVVDQLAQNLYRMYSLGVGQVIVTSLPPLGCLPRATASSRFETCDDTLNSQSSFHNFWLQQAVSSLNRRSNTGYSPFAILDLFESFMIVFRLQGQNDTFPGGLSFENPILKPCCMGVDENSACASVDAYGNKLYTVCDNPGSAFFWDNDHPTQAGWEALYVALQDTIGVLFRHPKRHN